MIHGVRVDPLRQLHDDRGAVFHMLRVDDPAFESFGEVYFSLVHADSVKAWHLHRLMTLNYAVPVGRIRLVLYDAREWSPTRGTLQQFDIGAEASTYARVRVPPGVWNGFLGLGTGDTLVANCATLPHDPDEIVRIPPDDPRVPFQWPRRGEVPGA